MLCIIAKLRIARCYKSVMDLTTPGKSAHHPERTLRAFDAVGISPSLRLLNRSEVAEVLDVSLKFLDRLVRDGHIVRLKIACQNLSYRVSR
jgi:hypothetical protein